MPLHFSVAILGIKQILEIIDYGRPVLEFTMPKVNVCALKLIDTILHTVVDEIVSPQQILVV